VLGLDGGEVVARAMHGRQRGEACSNPSVVRYQGTALRAELLTESRKTLLPPCP
jgi:hypothetical protein